MRISPISSSMSALPIHFFKLKKIKKSSKATSSSKTQKIQKNELQNQIIDPIDFIDGDSENSQAMWGDTEQFFEQECQNQDIDFKKVLTDAQWISKLHGNSTNSHGHWYKNPKVALHQVTIYEAIIYDAILHERWIVTPTHIKVEPIQNTIKNQLSLTMTLFKHKTEILHYKIKYYFLNQTLKLWDQHNQLMGSFKVIIRNRCLEEIEGTLYETPILLDPIWSSGDIVKSERVRLGKAKAEVYTSANQIQMSLINKNGIKIPVTINNIQSIFVNKGIFLTRKDIKMKNYCFSLNQLFISRLAIPFRFNTTITSI